jgi:GT2 family glycosyltransferase
MNATLPSADLVSVIVPICGRLAQTRLCLDALVEHTRSPWEVIVIDDNSMDGTVDHVLALKRTGSPITLITNHASRGFGAACNQGLRSARGGYIAVVHSETIVTKGWADHLIALMKTDPEMAVVGPMSNDAPPPQRVEGATYTDRGTLHLFAAQWQTANRGRWFDVERLCGNCLLAKRGIVDVVGGLDESLTSAFVFDDLSLKIRYAGGRMAVAQDLYVHHFVSPSVQSWTQIGRSWDQIPGMFDFELVYDAAVETADDKAVFVEIGCLAGRSTCYLGNQICNSNKAISLYAIDTAMGSPSDGIGLELVPSLGGSMAGILHRNILGCGLTEIIVPILTSSVRAATLFPNESVDFCFIDGDHSYESVTADLNAWWPKIRPGGMLAGHDYRGTAAWTIGLTPAVHDFFGVTDAAHPKAANCWAMTKLKVSLANNTAVDQTLLVVDVTRD